MNTQVTEADVIQTCEVHGFPLDPEQLEVVTAVVNQILLSASKSAAPTLSVWYGSMPETNGKTNWTAILHKGDIASGMTIDRSEYPDRVRYEADRARWLIGELDEEPFILDYDADKHSGYVAPAAPAQSGEPVAWQIDLAKWLRGEAGRHMASIAPKGATLTSHALKLRLWADQVEAPQPAQTERALTRDALQQKAIDHGFQYWRAPDAHGVTGTEAQAVELLQDLLGVEVEIEALTERALTLSTAAELKRAADLLDAHLGDTDPMIGDDMTQEEIEIEYPVMAAMQILVGLMTAATCKRRRP